MSRIKEFYEDLSESVTTAIYEECFDMPEHLENTRSDVYDLVWTAIIDGEEIRIINYMRNHFTNGKDMPKTAEAIKELYALVKGSDSTEKRYLDTAEQEELTESDMADRYQEYAYWAEFNGESKADSYEQWLNTALELGKYEEL